MGEPTSDLEEIWARFIGSENEIFKFIDELEHAYGIKFYPGRPKPDHGKPGKTRVYLKIPHDRPPIKEVET